MANSVDNDLMQWYLQNHPAQMPQSVLNSVQNQLQDRQQKVPPSLTNSPFLGHLMGILGTTGERAYNSIASLSGLPKDSTDYYQRWGNVQPGALDNIGESALEMIPAFKAARALGAAKLAASPFLGGVAENTAAGAIHGGLFGNEQGDDKLAQGAIEGLQGAGIGALFGALGAAGKPIGTYLQKKLVNPLLQKAAPTIQEISENFPWSKTESTLRENYKTVADATTQAYKDSKTANNAADNAYQQGLKEWGATPNQQENLASQLDASRPILYSGGLKNSGINSYISDLQSGIAPDTSDVANKFTAKNFYNAARSSIPDLVKEMDGNPNLQKAYEPAIGVLQNAIENTPQTFSEAAARVKDINAAMKLAKVATGTKDELLNGISGNLKTALNEDIRSSSVNTLASNPYEALQKANAANAVKKSFTSTPQPTGKEELNIPLLEFFKNKNSSNQAVLKNYMPTEGDTSAASFEKLKTSLGGDKDAAAGALQGHIFQNSLANGEPDLSKILSQYKKFSPEQRDWIFNPDQQFYLKNASEISTKLKNKNIGQTNPDLMSHGIGALLAHSIFGMPGLVGVGALYGAKHGANLIAKKMATPEGLNTLKSLQQNGFQFARPLGRAVTAASLVGSNPAMNIQSAQNNTQPNNSTGISGVDADLLAWDRKRRSAQ
jgi:hypothetical protein